MNSGRVPCPGGFSTSISRQRCESPVERRIGRHCSNTVATHPAIKIVGRDSVFNCGARHVIAVCADRVCLLREAPRLHPARGAELLENLVTKVARITEGGVTLDEAQLSGGGVRHVVLAGRVGVAEHSEGELGSRRKQRLVSCEVEQLLYGGGRNGVCTEVWLRWLLSELERLLQLLFCGVFDCAAAEAAKAVGAGGGVAKPASWGSFGCVPSVMLLGRGL